MVLISREEVAHRAIDEFGAMQKPIELAALLHVASDRNPKVVWEIGAGNGGTLWALATVLGPGHTYVSIDLPGGPFGGGPEAVTDERLAELVIDAASPCYVEIIRGHSQEIELPSELPNPPNLLLIDGDHTYAGVRADFRRYAPLVPPGGIIALHDIIEHSLVAQESGVTVHRFWKELLETEPRTWEIVDLKTRRPGAGRWGGPWGGWGLVYR